MASNGKVYAGDKGTLIRLDVGIDITGATVEIRVKFGNIEKVWAASANGRFVEFITTGTSNDILSAGNYILQAYVNKGGWIGLGKTTQLKVHPKYG